MNIANAIEGGLAGATTLTLLQEAIEQFDSHSPKRDFLSKPGIIKRIKKYHRKKKDPSRLYITLAGELLATIGYFGLADIGKKKNVVLRGGLLGAAAGLGIAFLNSDERTDDNPEDGDQDLLWDRLTTIALYTAGGVIAGMAIKGIHASKDKKSNKKKNKNDKKNKKKSKHEGD